MSAFVVTVLRQVTSGEPIELEEYSPKSSFGFILNQGPGPGILFDPEQERHLRELLNERARVGCEGPSQ